MPARGLWSRLNGQPDSIGETRWSWIAEILGIRPAPAVIADGLPATLANEQVMVKLDTLSLIELVEQEFEHGAFVTVHD